MSISTNNMPPLQAESDDEDNITSINNCLNMDKSTGMFIHGLRIVDEKLLSNNEADINEVDNIPCLLHFKLRNLAVANARLSVVLNKTEDLLKEIKK